MRNLTIYLAVTLCLLFSKAIAQQTFEHRARLIGDKIEEITKEEKAFLKEEVEAVNVELEKGAITSQQADERKLQLAEARAKNIETRVAAAQEELKNLVQEKVDGKIRSNDSISRYEIRIGSPIWFTDRHKKRDTIRGEYRTTSQFVFAMGVNNLMTDNALAHSDYRYWGSHFYEWGVTWNTRIMKNNNLLHAKYGLSVMYNNLRPTDNRMFVENGDQTELVESPIHLEDSRFRNVYLVAPLHLEFDFTPKRVEDGQTVFRTHRSFRFGIGGYGGVNVKSKQILHYERDGNDVKDRERGSFNVNDFIYGVSTYVGYGEVSLYVKYDLNPLFKDNAVDQNNISMGIRFDLN